MIDVKTFHNNFLHTAYRDEAIDSYYVRRATAQGNNCVAEIKQALDWADMPAVTCFPAIAGRVKPPNCNVCGNVRRYFSLNEYSRLSGNVLDTPLDSGLRQAATGLLGGLFQTPLYHLHPVGVHPCRRVHK